jgi:hypothetical protein
MEGDSRRNRTSEARTFAGNLGYTPRSVVLDATTHPQPLRSGRLTEFRACAVNSAPAPKYYRA